MIKRILYILFLIFNCVSFSQTPDELFEQANSLYQNEDYRSAITLYEQIIETKQVSSQLYFNLANSYYKLNEVAPSIYNYEKALQLDPLNTDAKNNLIFAKRLTLDRIEELPKSIFQKINDTYIQKLSYNSWAIVTILFSFISAVLFLVFYFSQTPSKKKLFFVSSTISFILLIASLAITFNQHALAKNTLEAIVFSDEVSVKNEPTKNADELFVLHEGTKVYVIDSVDNWKKIRLADGKLGWIINTNIKLLNLM